MKFVFSTALVALAIPVVGLAAPIGFGGFRHAPAPEEVKSVIDIVDIIDISVTVDSEADAGDCALLKADLKMALDDFIEADLNYQSCLATVEDGIAEEGDCDALEEVLDDAAYAYRLAARNWTNAGCE